jgi:hypothetical protein
MTPGRFFMSLIKNVEKRIWDVEGFDVVIRHLKGANVRSDMAGLPMYPYERAAKNDLTVTKWKKERFHSNYVGFKVDVLNGYGDKVKGNTKLGTVRDTYVDE